jgi:hypothetical protein
MLKIMNQVMIVTDVQHQILPDTKKESVRFLQRDKRSNSELLEKVKKHLAIDESEWHVTHKIYPIHTYLTGVVDYVIDNGQSLPSQKIVFDNMIQQIIAGQFVFKDGSVEAMDENDLLQATTDFLAAHCSPTLLIPSGMRMTPDLPEWAS